MSFPNPSDKNGFSVVLNSKNMKGKGELTISDLNGNVVYTKNIEVHDGISLWTISDIDLAPGVYFIQVSTENRNSKVSFP